MYSKLLFLLALITLTPTTAYTGVYKWTDKDGSVHYSQTRPENDVKSETLSIPGLKPGYATSDKKAKDKKEETKKSEQAAEETQKKENSLSKKESKALCQSARKNLAQLQSTGRVRQKDDKGNISYLSDKQKQAEIAKTQKLIKKFCK